MSWTYSQVRRDLTPYLIHVLKCVFCDIELKSFDLPSTDEFEVGTKKTGKICPECGWWKIIETKKSSDLIYEPQIIASSIGSLQELDLSDISLPLGEGKNYLSKPPNKIMDLNPRMFEELVASVFKDIGYNVNLSAHSTDGGIDIFLSGRENDIIGVQVKRYKQRIGVEQIRSMAGAMVLNKIPKGIFVTTSDFSKQATKTSDDLKGRGYPIELINADRFFNILQEIKGERSAPSGEDFLKKIKSLQDVLFWLGDFSKKETKQSWFYPPWSSEIPSELKDLEKLPHFSQSWWEWIGLLFVDNKISKSKQITFSDIIRIGTEYNCNIDAGKQLLLELSHKSTRLIELKFVYKKEINKAISFEEITTAIHNGHLSIDSAHESEWQKYVAFCYQTSSKWEDAKEHLRAGRPSNIIELR